MRILTTTGVLAELNRTFETSPGKAQTLNTRKCTDPSDDMKKSQENVIKTCTTSSVVRSGNSYTFTATCDVQGVTMLSKSVITAESDSAYRIKVETRAGDRVGNELLVAKRTGDC